LSDLTVASDGVLLSGEESPGRRGAVVLLHGLTATRGYVVMGSNVLARGGMRVIAYDARGHGQSAPATTPDAGQAPHDELLAKRAVAGILGIRT
jgi:3-oxoadipate enol-lactonase